MPSVPGLIGRLYVRRWSEWQSRQAETCSTRYLPRAPRSGVASTFSVDGGRCAGFFSESHDAAPASSATTTNRAMPSTLKNVFILLGLLFGTMCAELYYPAARRRGTKNVNAFGRVMRAEPQTTLTSTVPGGCGGTTTLRPLPTGASAVAGADPNETLQRASSPSPINVTELPPLAGALAGSTRVSTAPSVTMTSTENEKPSAVAIQIVATPLVSA